MPPGRRSSIPFSSTPFSFLVARVLTARCDARSARTQYMLTLKVAETWPVCTVCNGWVMLLCVDKTRFGGIIWGEVVMMHAQKFSISMYFLPTNHMSMNSELLAPGTGVFYLRGNDNEHVPTTIVGSSSKADCVAIQYERSGHSQLYADCPLDRLTFYFCTCRIFSTHYISFVLVVRAVAPFVSQAKLPPWQGVWAAATINTVGMNSLEWMRRLLHANHLDHSIPAYLPKGCTLH